MTRIFPLIMLVFNVWMLVDAYKRKVPYYWYFIIFFIPFGALIYFFVMKVPTLQMKRTFVRKPTVADLRHAYNTSPSVNNRLALARALCDAGQYEEARIEFEGVLSVHSDDKEALFGRGICHMGQRNYESAIESLSRITDQHPGFRDYAAWPLLAEAYWENGQREKSLSVLQILHRINPRLEHQVILARCLVEMNSFSEARKVLSSAIQDYRLAPAHVKKQNRKYYLEAIRLHRKLS